MTKVSKEHFLNRQWIFTCMLAALTAMPGPGFGHGTNNSHPEPAAAAQGAPAKQALLTRYASAIQSAIRANWLAPDGLPHASCKVRIAQAQGGKVESVAVEPDCPYDEAGKRSVVAAVKRADPLPYKGFESVFQRSLLFTFTPGP